MISDAEVILGISWFIGEIDVSPAVGITRGNVDDATGVTVGNFVTCKVCWMVGGAVVAVEIVDEGVKFDVEVRIFDFPEEDVQPTMTKSKKRAL